MKKYQKKLIVVKNSDICFLECYLCSNYKIFYSELDRAFCASQPGGYYDKYRAFWLIQILKKYLKTAKNSLKQLY